MLSWKTDVERRQVELEQKLEGLQNQLQLLVPQLDALVAAQIASDPVSAELDEIDSVALQEKATARFEELESNLLTQLPDPTWSHETEVILEDVLMPLSTDSDSELVAIECGNSFCRVESIHYDQDSLINFMEQASFDIDWNNSQISRVEDSDDGSSTLVMMISREGHSLPNDTW